jgi:hypothetical protein
MSISLKTSFQRILKNDAIQIGTILDISYFNVLHTTLYHTFSPIFSRLVDLMF